MEILLLRPNLVTRQILDILNVLTPTQKLTLEEARNIIVLQLKCNHQTYVGYEDGIPVCVGSFLIVVKLGRNGSRTAVIEDVAVSLDRQKMGYGKKLIKFLLKKIQQYNVAVIWLNCSNENVGFYEKCGFKKLGCQMKIYP